MTERLGTFLFPPRMRWLLDAMASAASETYTSTSAPIQHAAVRAFEGGPVIEEYLDHSRRILHALGHWTASSFVASGLRCPDPEGGFYLLPDFSPLAPRLARRGIETSKELAERLLKETGVALLPGSEFGRPERELTCRIAYVDFDGEAALEAVAQLPEDAPLGEEFLRQHAPRVCEAADRIGEWVAP